MVTSNKRIAKNTILLYFRMLVVMVVALFTSRVILKTLGASDFGVYNIVGGIVTMMSFLNSSLAGASSRFLTYALGNGDRKTINDTFSASLNLHIILALIVVLIGEPLGVWFISQVLTIPSDRLTAAFWILQFSLITTFVSFTQVPYSATLIAHENMGVYAYVGLYEAVSKLLIAYSITISPMDKLIFYALLLAINSCGIQLFYRFYTRKKYEECKFRIIKDKFLYKRLLSYSGWDMLGNIAVMCQGQGINTILNMFFGPIVNAARAVTVQIQLAIMGFIRNFLTAVKPQIVKCCAKKEYGEMYNLMFYSTKFSYLLMLMLSMPVIFEISTILDIWLGDSKPEYTEMFVVIVLITELIQTLDYSQLAVFHAIGRIKTGNIIGGGLMIITLPISYVGLKYMHLEPYWVFIIILVFNSLNCLTDLLLIHHYVPFSLRKLFLIVYMPCILITIIGVFVALLINYSMEKSIIRLVLSTISIEFVLLTSILLIALNRQEKLKIISIVKSKYHK